ncbi:hypothetical protein GCM10027447_38880 [Glycomyces halotolerans]
MLVSTARVVTDRAAGYADHLARHFSRRAEVEPLPGGYRLSFGIGEGLVNYGPDFLSLLVSADDGASLHNLRDALGIHLERFGHRDNLRVVWR